MVTDSNNSKYERFCIYISKVPVISNIKYLKLCDIKLLKLEDVKYLYIDTNCNISRYI